MKKVINIVIVVLLVWAAFCAAKPFWYRYWLGIEVEAAAIYGTKNSIKDTKMFLTLRMTEEGYGFKGEDFYIEKQKNNTTTVGITYLDEIAMFGYPLIPLEFTIEKTVREVAEML
ncbi:MAG: hypothetical protein JRK53_09600 [Deltaproteobacteria bacterium]|nr:hypothetical protein [Deltaproteobacteria bacterium]